MVQVLLIDVSSLFNEFSLSEETKPLNKLFNWSHEDNPPNKHIIKEKLKIPLIFFIY